MGPTEEDLGVLVLVSSVFISNHIGRGGKERKKVAMRIG